MNCRCRRVQVTIATITGTLITQYQAIAVPRAGDTYERGGIMALVEEVIWGADEETGTMFATVRIGLKP